MKDVQKLTGCQKVFNIPELERLFSNLKLNAPIGVDAYQLNREEIFTELMKELKLAKGLISLLRTRENSKQSLQRCCVISSI